MPNMQKMLKQAQRMQQDMERAQEELAQTEFTHTGNGVTVVIMGDNTIKSIDIDADLVADGDKDMLEDCVLVAVNAAMAKVQEESNNTMGSITDGLGLNLPGLT